MRIFVTGGNGFIGSRVVRLLCDAGHRVRCLLRRTSDTRRIDGLPVDRLYGDVRDARTLDPGLAGADAAIHLAGVVAWRDQASGALEEVVIAGTRNLLERARAAAGARLVHVSSAAAVNGSPEPRVHDEDSPFELAGSPLRYALAKHRAEQLVRGSVARGLEAVIVNPAEVYGPHDTGFVTAGNLVDVLRGWPAIACRGGTAIAHVDDVAAGIVAALERGRVGERYILGGDNLTIEELVRLTLELAGRRKPVVVLPNRLLRGAIGAMARLGLPTPVAPEVLHYATRYFFVDSGKAEGELGYRWRPARQVLEPVVEWLLTEGHV